MKNLKLFENNLVETADAKNNTSKIPETLLILPLMQACSKFLGL